ncbi:MAG: hypothetical protein EXR55_05440 [Dehalococcoidia bacterium]|nr:hypothetical protein [Dehalococcoidia bacterium]
MDFSASSYTVEQEQFRKEVRAWLEEHIPEEHKQPVDPRDLTSDDFQWWLQMRKEISKQGWLHPTFPKQYGGGGLTADHEAVIQEEFAHARVSRIMYSSNFIFPGLLVWATEEQKERFLKPLITMDKVCWYKMTEPQSGADLAGIQTRAVRDGDDWLVTGQNVFISGGTGPDRPNWLYGLAITDPDAPRHRNMACFMIPVPSEGLEIRQQNLLSGDEQHFIFLDNVRVPSSNMIGGDHQGWQVASSNREQEHSGTGRGYAQDEVAERLVEYARSTRHNGGTVGQNSVLQQHTMDAYLEAHVGNIMQMHNYWMYHNRMQVQYEGNMANVHNREYTLRNAVRVRDVMGLYSLLGARDPLAPHGGAQEVSQRGMAGQHHAGGSTNIIKVILARRIGISRTQERAAVTPATAGQISG